MHGGLATYLESLGIFILSVGEQRLGKKQEFERALVPLFEFCMGQFIFAIGGGLMLIVPLLLMVYIPGKTASVVISCVSVFIFAVQLAFWSFLSRATTVLSDTPIGEFIHLYGFQFGKFEVKDIVAATAAYAAVLVVFVGTSLSSK
jgi:hypothetical protein